MSAISVKVEGKDLVIRMPMAKDPQVTKSGKSRMVATTNGFMKTDAECKGEKIQLSVNAIIGLE